MTTETTTAKKAEAPKRTDLFRIKPENVIVKKGFNLRQKEDFGDIESLALSIKHNGQKTPLRVFRSKEDSNTFTIIEGHRRHAAILRAIELGADIQFIDAYLEPKNYNEKHRTIDMILCNEGLPLTPLAKAEGIKILFRDGLSIEEIATALTMSISSITNLIDLGNAPDEIKEQILDKKISGSAVISILKSTKKKDKEIAAELVKGKDKKTTVKLAEKKNEVAVALVKEAVSNAKKEGEKKGKAPKMATVKHVKSTSTVKGTLQILNEFADYIVEKEITGEDAMRFLQVLQAAKDKKGNKALLNILTGK